MMNETERYRTTSNALFGLFIIAAFIVVLMATIVGSSYLPDAWSVIGAILIFLFTTGFAMSMFDELRYRRWNGYFARLFPGYTGERFLIFDLLRHVGPGYDRSFNDSDTLYSLGEAETGFFVIQNRGARRNERLIGGKLLRAGDGRTWQMLTKADILDVQVIERGDAEIADSAVDRRGFDERIASEIAQRLTGTRVRRKIVPYAAYVVVTWREGQGLAQLVSAIPTDVTEGMLKALRDGGGVRPEDDDWLMDTLASRARKAAMDAATEGAGALGDQLASDNAIETTLHGIDTVKESMSWLNPDAASIATTDGQWGRAVAYLIAARIRASAGLDRAREPQAT